MKKKHWKSCVIAVCERHGLLFDGNVKQVKGCSNAVFVLGNNLYVKFFVERSHYENEVEGSTLALDAGVPTTRLLAHGLLQWRGGRKWPYTVSSRLGSQCVRDVFDITVVNFMEMAHFLGVTMRRLHRVALPGGGDGIMTTQRFAKWNAIMVARRTSLLQEPERHKYLRKALSPTALAQIESYLPQNVLPFFVWGDTPCFLHGDMNNENLRLRRERDRWTPAGILDFGDCLLDGGHRIYDFVAIHLSIFGCDKDALLTFLHAYGFENVPHARDFPRICMVYALLNESPALRTARGCLPEMSKCASLEQVATMIFDVSTPKNVGFWSTFGAPGKE